MAAADFNFVKGNFGKDSKGAPLFEFDPKLQYQFETELVGDPLPGAQNKPK